MSIQKPIELTLLNAVDISAPVCSVPQQLCFNYNWYLQTEKLNADGNPILKIEVSNDGIKWIDYICSATNITLDSEDMGFKDDNIPAKYFRLCLEPGTATTGTVTALMNLKPA